MEALSAIAGVTEMEQSQPHDHHHAELMAPGHIYNPRTGTGIEWAPANLDAAEPGRVRLWSRGWNGQPAVLGEAPHNTGSPWEYWYNLEFANSFPQVTHWWFGDAWTGHVQIWGPDAAGSDPESGAPMLSGWMRFGLTKAADPDTDADDADVADVSVNPALPWTVVLASPPRVSTPLPPMAVNLTNLPLQLLLAEQLMELLNRVADQVAHEHDRAAVEFPNSEITVTSLVRREHLQRAFPTSFNTWRLDKLGNLTTREAFCRVQDLEQPPWWV